MLPNTNNQFFNTAEPVLVGKGCFLFQMIDKRKLDILSYISRLVTSNEGKICTSYLELIGSVCSVTKEEHSVIDSDHFIKVLDDQKRNLSFFTEKRNFFQSFTLHKCNQSYFKNFLLRIQKGRIFLQLKRSAVFYLTQLELNHLKHKWLPLEFRFAGLTHDSQTKLVNFLVKHETVLTSQKDNFLPTLARFRNEQFSFGINDKERKSWVNHLTHFYLKLWNHSKVKIKNRSRKKAKHYCNNQQF